MLSFSNENPLFPSVLKFVLLLIISNICGFNIFLEIDGNFFGYDFFELFDLIEIFLASERNLFISKPFGSKIILP